jgi:ATP/maltotriose-dependent transcriptional regulator MalT
LSSCRHGRGRGITVRLTSSRLIGRSAELAELEAALAAAEEGLPAPVLVAGESGVGKTRLLAELQRRAEEGGALVLSGEAIDLGGDSELPYLPLVAALRPLARSGRLPEAISPLVPGLSAARPDRGEDAQPRLFEGLLSLLDELGQQRPVLLVLEDLQWADRSTRAALRFLGRSLTTERVMLVASYRSDELDRGHALRSLLAELERAPRAHRIALGPLTREQVAEQLADIMGAQPDLELLDWVWTRSGGNPLFGEELLAAGLGAAPDTLREALMLRVERLSVPAQELLPFVAIAERLDEPLLHDASGLDGRVLRDALREAVESHVLVAQDDGQYRFRHALLREILLHDLLAGERSELHLRLARSLEARLEDDGDARVTAAVAHHFAAAGDRPAALRSAMRAATAAERVDAYGEALALLERVLELWDGTPDAGDLLDADRVTVQTRASEAAAALGEPGRQLALLEAALAELGSQPDPRRAAPILEAIARAQRHLNRADASIATLERALELVGEDPSIRAGLLAGLARAVMIAGRHDEAVAVAREALASADKADLPLVEGNARNTLGFSIAVTGAVEQGAAELREAIRIAREHDDPSDLAVAYLNYADMLHMFGRSAEARAVAAEGREALVGVRPVAVTWFDAKLAELAFDVGDWEQAEAHLPVAQAWTGEQTRMGLAHRRAALAAGRGPLGEADQLIAELEPMAANSSEPQFIGPLAVLVADVRCRAGDVEAARAAVDEALDRIESASQDAMRAAAVAAAGVSAEADAAERARDLGDEEAEVTALRRIERLLARVAAAASPSRPVERAALAGARAEGAPDPAAYAQAAAAWDEVGRPEPAARMRWREADAQAEAGDREAATAAARAAHAAASRIGADWLRAEIEGLAARARLALDTADDEPEPPQEDAFGLTARERQVLALLADGATNRQIGTTLFMAEKTASVHVSRILTKLNARTRTEAAGVAHRHRLLD